MYFHEQDGVLRQLERTEWRKRKRELDALGGPCDLRRWDDLSVGEK